MTVVEDPPSESLQETPTLAEPSTSDDATNAEPAEKWTIAATVLKLKLGHVISGAAIGLGIAVAATAFAGAPWHVMVTLFVVGCFVTPLQAAISTLLQTSVDNALLGRVQSAMNTTIGAASSNPAIASVRRTVACSSESSPISGNSCLGYFSRESGHSRVPDPPDSTTG